MPYLTYVQLVRYEEIRAARFSSNKQEDQGLTSPDLAEADEHDVATNPGRSQDDVMISAETPTDGAVAVGEVQGGHDCWST